MPYEIYYTLEDSGIILSDLEDADQAEFEAKQDLETQYPGCVISIEEVREIRQ